MYNMTKINDVVITKGLLAEKRRLAASVTVPYIRKAIFDEHDDIVKSGAAENFKIAAGRSHAQFHGLVSQDSDMFKWMEAASLALLVWEDKEEKEKLDMAIELIGTAQQKDGYLNTYFIINGLKNKWGTLKEACQLYCAGHLLEAAVSNYEAAGEKKLLQIAISYANCIERVFGEKKGRICGYDGHAEIELALYRLYEVTGFEKYRKLAGFFVEERGKKPCFFSIETADESIGENLVYALSEEDYQHSQSHLPIREQKEAKGHAVKAMYFYTAAADKARIEQDKDLRKTVERLWEDVTEKKMYITGAIGSSEFGESFTYAYDLPGDLVYGETCASIGLFLWGYHMLLDGNDRKYSDVMERTLYNGILCGISEQGTEFFYTNPLEIDPARSKNRKDYSHLSTKRQKWFACPCCPPNIARLLLSLQRYLYTVSDSELNIHLFAENQASFDDWNVNVITAYPTQGEVRILISKKKEAEGTVRIRIPGWCTSYRLMVNRERVFAHEEHGYVVLEGRWETEKEIALYMDMPPVFLYTNKKVTSLTGKAAVMKGPVVYCAEEADNGKLTSLFFNENGCIREEAGCLTVEGYEEVLETEKLYSVNKPEITARLIHMIPYYLWNNRGEGEMKVFFCVKR